MGVLLASPFTHTQWPRKAAAGGPGGDALAPSADADTFMEEVLQLNVATYVSGVGVGGGERQKEGRGGGTWDAQIS